MPRVVGLIKKKQLKDIFIYVFHNHGREPLVRMADEIKNLGFTFATRAGISFASRTWKSRRRRKSSS